MYQTEKVLVPTANVAINKSRIKVYDKESSQPIYYLKDGTEFQLEIFNPTKSTILSKISIDGKLISQTGLVLRPGERIFLDRYLDIAKKFKFSTYIVDNTEEVKEAISDNGKLMVEFYEEYIPLTNTGLIKLDYGKLWNTPNQTPPFNPNTNPYYIGDMFGSGDFNTDKTITTLGNITTDGISTNASSGTYTTTSLGFADMDMNSVSTYSVDIPSGPIKRNPKKTFKKKFKKSKKIETGQIEKGSSSDQTMELVDKTFLTIPFHTVEYKLLPTSQKNVTSDELIQKYCVSCGGKLKKGDNFCGKCGVKI